LLADDGVGGADQEGGGLRGLADRVEAAGSSSTPPPAVGRACRPTFRTAHRRRISATTSSGVAATVSAFEPGRPLPEEAAFGVGVDEFERAFVRDAHLRVR
jgi:hypothetical protein